MFVGEIERQGLNCEGVVVFRHGEKAAEHRWVPEKPTNSFSVSKSFVSIAVGMAVDRQRLSTDMRMADVFGDLAEKPGKRLASLTLGHLLTMTRGHAGFSRPGTVADALSQPLSYRPGTRFVYDNGSTFLATAMFTRVMGTTVRDFLLDALFGPLGIAAPEWPQSRDGHTMGATGLALTTSDLAVFGRFLLGRGRWQGEQLVSPGWIDCATRPHVRTGSRKPDSDLGYGYCFWPCRHGAYRADGKNGQFLVVLPRQDAVVAINSNEPRHAPILDAVWSGILPLL